MCCKEEKLYKKPWFWLCIAVIVFCITRPYTIIMCGNGCSNGNGGKEIDSTK